MEHTIGTRIMLDDGSMAEVVEDHICVGCIKCFFEDKDCLDFECESSERTDGKNIIYKEIKKTIQ